MYISSLNVYSNTGTSLARALIHDLGQYPLAHDLQEVHAKIFDHSSISIDLLSDGTEDRKRKDIAGYNSGRRRGWGVSLD